MKYILTIESPLELITLKAMIEELSPNTDVNNISLVEPEPAEVLKKTEANSCQLRYLGGRWVVSDSNGDHPYNGLEAVIMHMNSFKLYLTNETIMTAEYAAKLWYKRS